MQIKIDNIIKETSIDESPDDVVEKAKSKKLNGDRNQGDQVGELILSTNGNGWQRSSKRKNSSRSKNKSAAAAPTNGDDHDDFENDSSTKISSANGNSKTKHINGLNNNSLASNANLKLLQQRGATTAENNNKTDLDNTTTTGDHSEQDGNKSSTEPTKSPSETASATTTADEKKEFKAEIVWFNIFLFVVLHSSLPVAVYKLVTEWPLRTFAWAFFCIYASGLGVTGGAHRLWSHRSYKASKPVEILLMLLQTMAGQNSIYTWSRDHRVHHKFSETDADPHNIKRGFFFAHMGWLCCKKHPDVKEKGKLIDMSDLEANPIVMFQHRHFWWLSILCNVAAPMAVPIYFWNESYSTAFTFPFMLRYLITLHGTWLVNSAAHYHGSRPYDKRIEARESPLVIATALGEGFHNYHHTFPFDYSTSEFGKYLNITTAFIDLCASMNLTYDLRKVDPKMIRQRQERTGDGTHLELEQLEKAAADDSGEHEMVLQSSTSEDSLVRRPLNNLIRHELPYISAGSLTSMKYTM